VRLSLLLFARTSPAAVRALIPPELAFLASAFQPTWRAARAEVEVTQEQAARIVAWGEQRREGKTILEAIRWIERFEPADLPSLQVAELRPPEGEMPQVANAPQAYLGRWLCTHCDRTVLEQRGPLAVEWTDAPRDLEQTASGELLVRKQYREPFTRAGLEVRALVGTDAVLQVVVPATADLRTDTFPLSRVYPCPGCGRATIERSETVQGSLEASQEGELYVAREFPLVLGPGRLGGPPMAAAPEPLGWNGLVTKEPRHVAGALFDLNTEPAWTSQGSTVVFAEATLLSRLATAGARSFFFLPATSVDGGVRSTQDSS
jgi:hypothetical protein